MAHSSWVLRLTLSAGLCGLASGMSGCATMKATFNPVTSKPAHPAKVVKARKAAPALASKAQNRKGGGGADNFTSGLNLGKQDKLDRDLLELGTFERGTDHTSND